MKRVLVTGGAGFIGSHVVDRLRAAGYAAVIFDVTASPWPEHADVPSIQGSILDTDALARAAAGCEAIVHLAAAADVGIVAEAPVPAEELNARGTLSVLEAARATGARVVYASTIWVYSDTPGDVLDEDSPLLAPAHVYSATKLAGEFYCRSYRELYGVPSTVLRFGIPYGPRARPAAVLPIFVGKALAGEPLTIAGDGRQTRRFVYVEDLAAGVVAALASRDAVDRTYNLVGVEETSVRDIADAVRAAVGDVPIVHTEGRAGDFAGAVISGERAARELGWRPRTAFGEGVRRYVEWHAGERTRVEPTPAPSPAPRARPLPPRVGQRVPLTVSLLVAAAYAVALATLGIGSAQVGTVTAAAVLLAVAYDVRERVPSVRGLVAGTLAGLVLLAIPPLAHLAELAPLTPPLLILAIIGAAGALGMATGAQRAAARQPVEQS